MNKWGQYDLSTGAIIACTGVKIQDEALLAARGLRQVEIPAELDYTRYAVDLETSELIELEVEE
jgi:hypothetical protein